MTSNSDIQDLHDKIVTLTTGKPGDLTEAAFVNVMVSFTIGAMATRGGDPYILLRHMYREAKRITKEHLAQEGLSSARPKGAKPN